MCGEVYNRNNCEGVSEAAVAFSLCSLSLAGAVAQWREEGCVAVWLHVPIFQSGFAAAAASQGFTFHHAEQGSSTLTLWLGEGPSRLPGYATHQLGVAG